MSETPADEASTPLQRYEQRMRRSRTVYYAVLAVIVVALGAVAVVVLNTGEIAHATLRTAQAPPDLVTASPSAVQTRAWSTADRVAAVDPVYDGTVVTYSTHSVGGRNARTGARTWLYTRTDRTVCAVLQSEGITVAVYRRDGTCDEVSAFHSGTGQRSWTRTLDEDGNPVDGTPTFLLANDTFVAYTPAVIYAITAGSSPGDNGGVDRWTYDRYGCAISHVVLGSIDGAPEALVSQNCTNVSCTGISFCGKGHQVFLRDGDAGRLDKDQKNFDQITWNDLGNTGVPVSADALVSVVQPGSNVLDALDPKTGKASASIELSPAPNDLEGITAVATNSAELIWLDGRLIAVSPTAAKVTWSAAVDAPPSVVGASDLGVPDLASSRITVTTSGGVAALDPSTGAVRSRFTVPVATAAGSVAPLGTGFVVSGTSGTAAYR